MTDQKTIGVEITYTGPDQIGIFHHPAKYKIFRGPRRSGKTGGAAAYCKEFALEKGGRKILWVDTTNPNVEKYAQELFVSKLPSVICKFQAQKKVLKFLNGSFVQFASADKPENIEGHAYDLIILNEAGIILGRRPLLWSQTILPMTIDNPDCRVLIVGTWRPGAYIFDQLCEKARERPYGKPDAKGKKHEWMEFQRSTYDNPLLSQEAIAEVEAEVAEIGGDPRQEIWGEITKKNANAVTIPDGLVKAAVNRNIPMVKNIRPKWGVDVAGAGRDRYALAKRCANWLLEPVKLWPSSAFDGDTQKFAMAIAEEYDQTSDELKPSDIFVDGNGVGKGVYDRLKEMQLPARIVMVQEKANNEDRFVMLRDEIWWRCRSWFMEKTCRIPNDKTLIHELSIPLYDPDHDKGRVKVESKKEMKRRGVRSPDVADALVLTFAGGRDRASEKMKRKKHTQQQTGTWMAA